MLRLTLTAQLSDSVLTDIILSIICGGNFGCRRFFYTGQALNRGLSTNGFQWTEWTKWTEWRSWTEWTKGTKWARHAVPLRALAPRSYSLISSFQEFSCP